MSTSGRNLDPGWGQFEKKRLQIKQKVKAFCLRVLNGSYIVRAIWSLILMICVEYVSGEI